MFSDSKVLKVEIQKRKYTSDHAIAIGKTPVVRFHDSLSAWLMCAFKSPTLSSFSGFQSPMLNVFETIHVPGFKSFKQFGAKFQIHLFEHEKSNDGCLVNIGIE